MRSRPHRPRGRLTTAVTTLALAVAGLTVPTAMPAHAAATNLTQYVNPFIGTDDSNSPNPVPGGAGGSTFPGAEVPFGMVQFSPDTPTGSPSGYRYSDGTVEDFSLTHFDGAGCANRGPEQAGHRRLLVQRQRDGGQGLQRQRQRGQLR